MKGDKNMQKYTSRSTSINSTRLPVVYRKIRIVPGTNVFDFGCGRYTDHIRAYLYQHNMHLLPYDPFNQSESTNKESIRTLLINGCSAIVCSNVLNVIDDDLTIVSILKDISTFVRLGATAYLTVYEGNRTGIGKQTGKDQWQRNQPLRTYLQYVPDYVDAHIERGMIVLEPKC